MGPNPQPHPLPDPPHLHHWVKENRQWVLFGAVATDPTGPAGTPAPSAILVAGFDQETGVLDVVEADIRRRRSERLIEELIACQIQHACALWVVEGGPERESFREEVARRAQRRRVRLTFGKRPPRGDPPGRLAILAPLLAQGLIRLGREQEALTRQLTEEVPGGAPPPGATALHLLWQVTGRGRNGPPPRSTVNGPWYPGCNPVHHGAPGPTPRSPGRD